MIRSCFLFFCTILCADPQVVHLKPPPISPEMVQQLTLCTRPARQEKFNISVEEKEGKTVVHCYGFGGFGWTCLFGSVHQAIELFEQTHPFKEIPIRIIGAGCIGLTCALELSSLGYKVAGISTKELYDTASWRAGGLFDISPARLHPSEKLNLEQITLHSFLTYRDIEAHRHPYFPANAVHLLPIYFLTDRGKGLFPFEHMGLIPLRTEVTLDFGNGVTHPGYSMTYSYYIDTALAMKGLLKEVEARAIPIEIKEIKTFAEVPEEVIFNCTGLGSYTLNADAAVYPVYGHLALLAPQDGPMDYMLATFVPQNGRTEALYFFPKTVFVSSEHPEGMSCGGVLGGTFITSDEWWNDQDEFYKLLDRASLFFHGVSFYR